MGSQGGTWAISRPRSVAACHFLRYYGVAQGLAVSYNYRLTAAVTEKSVWEDMIPLNTEVTLPPRLSYLGERRHGFGKVRNEYTLHVASSSSGHNGHLRSSSARLAGSLS